MNFELYINDFITLASAHFIALLSPGVDFFIIITNSTKYGKVSGILTALGISFANLFYIIMALFGIILIKNNIYIFITIKISGAIYLIYLSYQLVFSRKRELFEKNIKQKNKKYFYKSFLTGFISALLNPKNSIFYFTMFSISIQNDTPIQIQAFFAFWMFCAVLSWDILIVYLVNNKKNRVYIQQYSNIIEKSSGGILFFIAILILLNI